MKSRKSGFTLVELLTVLVIIALMMGILLPALNKVRNTAKEAKQKVQFATIEQAIMAFKSDYGDYPNSTTDMRFGTPKYYCGAQQLAEALVGWDMLGFHPKSDWRYDGLDVIGGPDSYDPTRFRGDKTLYERKGPYLELAKANVFRLGKISVPKPGLFNNTKDLAADTYVLCDSFGIKKLTFQNGPNTEIVTAGTPILYYRAKTSSKGWFGENFYFNRIYNYDDNSDLIGLGRMTDGKVHPLANNISDPIYPAGEWGPFYRKLSDPKMFTSISGGWPVNADSYVLISAGADGLYGTADDITNF